MDTMDGDGEDVEPVPHPRHVVSPEGGTDLHYDLWCFTSPLGVKIQCIVISPVDDRFLLAVPQQVWHRQVAKRVLPPQMLGKPTLIEVACSPEEERDVVDDAASIKLWVGYVAADVYESLEIMEPDMALDYRFKSDESSGFVPYAGSLMEVLKEHFEFLSAESGDRRPTRAAGSQDLSSRVSTLEASLGKMAENLDILLQKITEQKGSGSRVRFSQPLVTEPRTTKRDARSEKFPTLDAAVVSAALAAGVSEENLLEMQKMMGAGQGASRRMREPALRTASPRPKAGAREPLSESEEDLEEQDEPGSAPTSGDTPMENALTKLTELVSLLASDCVKKAKASKVDLALDGLVSGSGAESTGASVGKRAAAARRALRTALIETPEEIYMVVERLLLEDLTSRTVAHGMPRAELNARAWIEHRSKIGAYKTSAHCAWGVGGILDDLVQGRAAHARARASLLLLQLDQCAVDKGDWTLACELSLEQGPPLSTLATHTPPRVNEGESPFSKLLDSRWSEVMLAHLKDAEDYVQKRRTLGRRLQSEDGNHEAAKPKAKPKAKGKPGASNDHSTDA